MLMMTIAFFFVAIHFIVDILHLQVNQHCGVRLDYDASL